VEKIHPSLLLISEAFAVLASSLFEQTSCLYAVVLLEFWPATCYLSMHAGHAFFKFVWFVAKKKKKKKGNTKDD
jgi:hypothetical protein